MTLDFIRALAAIRVLAVLAALTGVAGRAGGQSLGEPVPAGYEDYLLLLRTPAGALPPVTTASMLGVAQQSLQLVARYGYVADITQPLARGTAGREKQSLSSFGLTGVIPAGLAGTMSLTAGVANVRCDGCRAQFMAALGGDYRLFAAGLPGPQNWRLTVGGQAEVGYGKRERGSAWSGKLGVPIAVTVGATEGTRVVPFLVPALSLVSSSGDLSDNGSSVGALFSTGGGVALYNPKSRVGASVGFQYVFVSASELAVGVAVSIGGR